MAVAAYMIYENTVKVKMNSVHKVQPEEKLATNGLGENGKADRFSHDLNNVNWLK